MRLALAFTAAATLAGCSMLPFGGSAPVSADAPAIQAALAAPSRPQADRDRDAARKAAETLAFARIRPGQAVGDMIIGGGYFTRLLSEAVGPEGRVIAWQPAEFIRFQASYGENLTKVDEERENVSAIRSPIGAPEFGTGQLDLVFTAQNYHDLHLRPFAQDTAAKVNAAVFQALKPGGLYVVIDHHGAPGSGLAVADSLHRIDPAIVKQEVTAAGFVLDGESDMLANTTDPLTANVFDGAIRGKTSQFMLRFRKPR